VETIPGEHLRYRQPDGFAAAAILLADLV
jgi:hypothetical protein